MSNLRFPRHQGISNFISGSCFLPSTFHVPAGSVLGGFLAAKMLAPTRASAMGKLPRDDRSSGATHCFLKGTQILTVQGERPIEDLRIGDLIATVSGEPKPIKWIGRLRVDRGSGASWNTAVAPIRIARGAFNGDLPHSDLYVSHGHRILINGLLIPAGDLVNGSSIARLTSMDVDVLEYLHIELASHEVILANGAPAETLEGNASRTDFDNFDEYRRAVRSNADAPDAVRADRRPLRLSASPGSRIGVGCWRRSTTAGNLGDHC